MRDRSAARVLRGAPPQSDKLLCERVGPPSRDGDARSETLSSNNSDRMLVFEKL